MKRVSQLVLGERRHLYKEGAFQKKQA